VTTGTRLAGPTLGVVIKPVTFEVGVTTGMRMAGVAPLGVLVEKVTFKFSPDICFGTLRANVTRGVAAVIKGMLAIAAGS